MTLRSAATLVVGCTASSLFALSAGGAAAQTATIGTPTLDVSPSTPGAIPLPPVVVSASRVPVSAADVGSSVTVITAEEIRARGLETMTEVLRQVPGVAVSQAGTPGSLTQVRIRGGEANQALVLVDGIEVNAVGDGDFDFAEFLVDDVERLEVIRGPQSGLYGANASSGVISIITKSGRGLAKPEADGKAEAGSFGTVRGALSARGAAGDLYGSITAAGTESQGTNIARHGDELDGSSSGILTGKFGADITPDFNVEGTVRHVNRDAESDPQDFTSVTSPPYGFVVDGNDQNSFQSTAAKIAATLDMFDGRLTSRTAGSIFDQAYDFSSRTDGTYHSEGTRTQFEQALTGRSETDLVGGETHTTTAAFDYRDETFQYRSSFLDFDPEAAKDWERGRSRTRTSLSAEHITEFAFGLTLSGAIRQDWNSGFKDATTFRVTGSQKLATGTRVHGSVGTGITDPTFFEQFGLFSNFVGNPNLVPERSFAWDIGVEQQFWDGLFVGDVTYFHADLKDEIVQVFTVPNTVENLKGQSLRQGVELTGTLRPVGWLDLTASYTYTDSQDATGLTEIRRPPHSASLSAVARFDEDRGRIALNVVYNGTAKDIRSVPAAPFTLTVDLPAYTLIGGEVAYKFTPEVTGYVRAENILDDRYEDVFSYRAPGFGAFAGVKMALR